MPYFFSWQGKWAGHEVPLELRSRLAFWCETWLGEMWSDFVRKMDVLRAIELSRTSSQRLSTKLVTRMMLYLVIGKRFSTASWTCDSSTPPAIQAHAGRKAVNHCTLGWVFFAVQMVNCDKDMLSSTHWSVLSVISRTPNRSLLFAMRGRTSAVW